MNKKQLTTTVIIFIALLLTSLFVLKKEDSNWGNNKFADKTPLITGDFDVNKIAKFTIIDDKKTLEVEIKNDKWVVLNRDSYPANFAKIRNFVMRIRDLKIAQKLWMKKSAYGSVKLLLPKKGKKNEGTGTLLSFYDQQDKKILSLLLGAVHLKKSDHRQAFAPPKKDGRYVMIPGTDKPVLTIDPLSDASTNPALWLDKSFIKLSTFKSMRMLDTSGKTKWEITRKTKKGPFSLKGLKKGQKIKPRKMFEVTSAFSKLNFLDVLSPDTDKKITGLNQPATVIFETFEDMVYKIKLATKDKKGFAKIAISSSLPEKRISDKKEKPENRAKLDREFAEKQKAIQTTLKKEKIFTEWIYEFQLRDIQKILIDRKEMIE